MRPHIETVLYVSNFLDLTYSEPSGGRTIVAENDAVYLYVVLLAYDLQVQVKLPQELALLHVEVVPVLLLTFNQLELGSFVLRAVVREQPLHNNERLRVLV